MSLLLADLRTAAWALAYLELGWRIWPVVPGTKRPYPHAPLGSRGAGSASGDPEIVAAWWRWWPWASIGGVLPPGRVVVDIDSAALTPASLPRTLTAETGRGWHVHFAHRGDLRKTSDAYPGVDLLRPGMPVMLPPSLHATGKRYRWAVDAPVVALPGRLADAFAAPPPLPWRRTSGSPDARRQAICRRLADAQPTERHNLTHWATRRYAEMGLSADDALADFLAALPLAADFTEADVRSTVRSVLRS